MSNKIKKIIKIPPKNFKNQIKLIQFFWEYEEIFLKK